MPVHLDDAALPAPQQLGTSAWWRSALPQSLGPCFSDRMQFGDGLALVYSSYQPTTDVCEHRTIERPRSLTLTFALQGRSSTRDARRRYDFIDGQASVAVFADARGERSFSAGQAVRQLRLIADETLLQRYGLEHLLQPSSADAAVYRHSAQARPARRLADRLVHLHDHGGSVLDLHSSALALLAEQVRDIAPRPREHVVPINSAEQTRMLQARELLLQRYAEPWTLASLALQVGSTGFTLKKGFKALFGISPQQMLLDFRMAAARELLDTGLHVSSVAYRVGYQHLSSFSTAFLRHHGYRPTQVAARHQHRQRGGGAPVVDDRRA